jgi:hypothetical protein
VQREEHVLADVADEARVGARGALEIGDRRGGARSSSPRRPAKSGAVEGRVAWISRASATAAGLRRPSA